MGHLGSILGLGRPHGEGKGYPLQYSDLENSMKYIVHMVAKLTSLVAQTVKRLPTMWETRVRSLGREYLLEKDMATHSSTLA